MGTDAGLTNILLAGLGSVVSALVYVYTLRERDHERRYQTLEKGHEKCDNERLLLQEKFNDLNVQVGELRGEAQGINFGKSAIQAAHKSIEEFVEELRSQVGKDKDV